jgi:HD domain-containing protein
METLLTDIPAIDEVLLAHAAELGKDSVGYRNHAYRVANLCLALTHDGPDRVEKIAIAAAFHDLGIWTDRTFDYLPPSVRLAKAYLVQSGRPEWIEEVERIILEHHKLSASQADPHWLVESFRKADWIDVSRGFLTFGLSDQVLTPILSTWPSAGFHKRLVEFTMHRFRTNPLTPLPMLKF